MQIRANSAQQLTNGRQGSNILELLLALAILSVSLYPIVYIFRIAHPPRQKTHTEYLATLLAHHAMETIIARKALDSAYLPTMSDPEPVVQSADAINHVSEYFRDITESGENISEDSDSQLFWSLKQFNCSIDTYYLEGALFKAIVYVTYLKDGRTMKVFFERLLSQSEALPQGEAP